MIHTNKYNPRGRLAHSCSLGPISLTSLVCFGRSNGGRGKSAFCHQHHHRYQQHQCEKQQLGQCCAALAILNPISSRSRRKIGGKGKWKGGWSPAPQQTRASKAFDSWLSLNYRIDHSHHGFSSLFSCHVPQRLKTGDSESRPGDAFTQGWAPRTIMHVIQREKRERRVEWGEDREETSRVGSLCVWGRVGSIHQVCQANGSPDKKDHQFIAGVDQFVRNARSPMGWTGKGWLVGAGWVGLGNSFEFLFYFSCLLFLLARKTRNSLGQHHISSFLLFSFLFP